MAPAQLIQWFGFMSVKAKQYIGCRHEAMRTHLRRLLARAVGRRKSEKEKRQRKLCKTLLKVWFLRCEFVCQQTLHSSSTHQRKMWRGYPTPPVTGADRITSAVWVDAERTGSGYLAFSPKAQTIIGFLKHWEGSGVFLTRGFCTTTTLIWNPFNVASLAFSSGQQNHCSGEVAPSIIRVLFNKSSNTSTSLLCHWLWS